MDIDDLVSSATVSLEVIRDNPPNITITSPSNGQTFNNPNIAVTASASDDFALRSITIILNGNTVRTCQISTQSGVCSVNVDLSLGANMITAIATDDIGQQNSQSISVIYRPLTTTPTPTPPTPAPTPTPTPSTPMPTPTPPSPPRIGIIRVPDVSWQKTLSGNNIITSP